MISGSASCSITMHVMANEPILEGGVEGEEDPAKCHVPYGTDRSAAVEALDAQSLDCLIITKIAGE